MSSHANMIKTGSIVGTGAAKKVVLGFKPVAVQVVNATGLVSAHKTNTMDGSNGEKRITDGTMTFPANLITLDSDGFTVGTDTDLNVAGEVLHYTAYEARNE